MRLLDVLVHKQALTPPPVWMMRQAGRYLPEYRQVRSHHPDFMEFCFATKDVVEVTLQPLRRFNLDAAIIFSDILVIPHVLGQKVWFEANHGPKLEKVDWSTFLAKATTIQLNEALSPVADAIAQTRSALDPSKALLGFAGAPWTLLTYMISNGKTQNFDTVLDFAQKNPFLFDQLLTLLTDRVAQLLCLHIEAGVNAVQIFESWAMAVPAALRFQYLYKPLAEIVKQVRQKHPTVPIIYYGRGVSQDYPTLNHLDLAFGVDETACLKATRMALPHAVLQGNLSPSTLLNPQASHAAHTENTGANPLLSLMTTAPYLAPPSHTTQLCSLEDTVDSLLHAMQGTPYIFNLGHGINKDTPLSHVERMLNRIQSWKG